MLYPCVFSDEISLDFEEAVRVCVAEGLHAIQIRQVGVRGRNVVDLPDDELWPMVRIVRRYGVQVAGIGSPVGKCGLDDTSYRAHAYVFERALRVAEIFDTQLVRIFAFYPPQQARGAVHPEPFAEAMPRIVERLHGLADCAQRAGITLGLENEYTTLVGTCRDVRHIIDAVDSPALTICWDVASGWYIGEPVIPDGYEHVRGRVCDIHVRDARAHPADVTRHGEVCLVGDGAIDWTSILTRLSREGYRGPWTLEPHLFLDDAEGGVRRHAATVQSIRVFKDLIAEAAKASTQT